MKGMANTAPYSDQWVDCTDNAVIDIAAEGSHDDDSYWPTMIQLDFYEDGCTITSGDARRLAEMLVKAADSADAIDNARFATEESSDASAYLNAKDALIAELEALVREAEDTGRLSTEWGNRARLALKGRQAETLPDERGLTDG